MTMLGTGAHAPLPDHPHQPRHYAASWNDRTLDDPQIVRVNAAVRIRLEYQRLRHQSVWSNFGEIVGRVFRGPTAHP